MDTDSVETLGTQYIICECGDNFRDERLLNIHLANGHSELETFQCDACPEIFTSEELFQKHSNEHQVQKLQKKSFASDLKAKVKVATTQDAVKKVHSEIFISDEALKQQRNGQKTRKPHKNRTYIESSFRGAAEIAPREAELPHITLTPKQESTTHDVKTYSKKEPTKAVPTKPIFKTPVIKVNNLKRIDSISLIQNLKEYGNLIKIHSSLMPEVQEEQVTEAVESVTEEPVIVKSEVEHEDVNEEIYYQCDVCNTIFYTESDFDVHYQSTHAMKVEVTPEEILEEHLVSDHSDHVNVKAEMEETVETAYYFECEMCHKIFASEEYFNIHYSKAHGGLLTVSEPLQELTEQEKEEELTEDNPIEENQDYSVEEYNDEQESRDAPKAPEQVIYFKCDLCKILYPSEKAYNSHFSRKHGGGAGFRYIEQDISGDYPSVQPPQDEFCCEFCPKTFSMRRSLQVHRKRVHAERLPRASPSAARAPSRSKVCDVCGRAYNSNAALRYHQRRHTGEKPYPCTVCPKRFTMPMFLQIHLRTHTGEKPYECQQCPKAFTNKAALIRHNRVHTGEKPYPCPECGKFFTQSNSMKLHVSTVHLKLPAPYKSKSRRSRSEARALQLALKALPADGDE